MSACDGLGYACARGIMLSLGVGASEGSNSGGQASRDKNDPYRWSLGAETVFFGPGGARGVAHIGWVVQADKQTRGRAGNPFARPSVPLVCCGGASIGALVGTLVALGISPHELEELSRTFVAKACPGKPAPTGSMPTPKLPPTYTTGILYAMIMRALRSVEQNPNQLTLGDVAGVAGVELVLLASVGPSAGGTPVILSARTMPQMLVRDALYASMAIPGVVDPLRASGQRLVDGAYGVMETGVADAWLRRAMACRGGGGRADQRQRELFVFLQSKAALMGNDDRGGGGGGGVINEDGTQEITWAAAMSSVGRAPTAPTTVNTKLVFLDTSVADAAGGSRALCAATDPVMYDALYNSGRKSAL